MHLTIGDEGRLSGVWVVWIGWIPDLWISIYTLDDIEPT